jgi:predicted permease
MPIFRASLRQAALRLRAIFFHRALEDDMQAEMRDHLDRATERYLARGMSPTDARLAARREFGNVTALQEEGRDARRARWIDALRGDVRFAFRYFARHKATTAIIVAVLALGTGANTLIFSLLQAQFFRPAPAMRKDDALARVWAQERPTRTARWQLRGFTQLELAALADRREVFRAVGAWTEDEIVLRADSTSARAVGAQFVTPNFFGMVGVALSAGRGFQQDVGDADMTAIMSYAAAEQLYGSAAAAVGRQVLVNEVPVDVVGVAPPRFQGAQRSMGEPVLWLPMSARTAVAHISPRWPTEEAALSLFARLTPNVSRAQATALVRQVVTSALPDSAARVGMARTADVLSMQAPEPGEGTQEMLFASTLMTAIGALILLVGWMNVSSLMVAAAVGRRHEIAVRLSLGASRVRLIRQLVTESTIIAMVGSAVGLMLTYWVLVWMANTEVHEVDLTPDIATFTFVLMMAVATGVLFGLSPALHATRAGVSNALRDSGTGTSGRSRLQRRFVVAQIALSQPLLVLLGTMISLVVVEYRPLSPEMARRVITATFRPLERTGAPSQRREAVDSLIPRIAERPEVLAAVPQADAFAVRGVVAADRRTPNVKADTAPTVLHLEGAAPGWFAVLDVPIVLGRDVTLADTAAAEYPVVIGTDLARALWGGANPIGRTLASPVLPGLEQDSIGMTVVGVYDASVRRPGMTWGGQTGRTNVTPHVYTARGKQWRHDQVLVRLRGPAAPYVPVLQQFVREHAPAMPVTSMLTLEQLNTRAYRETWRVAGLAGAGGALALLLASLGLYGVISLAVRQRTREIGIRIALGARPVQVARMFLTSGVRASVVALALGLPLSIVALRIALSQGLVIAPKVNPYVIGLVIAPLLVAVAMAATWVPARRASRVDPARTLRME